MTIDLDGYGFPLTTGIFETIKTANGEPLFLERHLCRAKDAALEIGLSIPNVTDIHKEVEQHLLKFPLNSGKLRISFFDGGIHISHQEYLPPEGPARVNFFSHSVDGLPHKYFPYTDRYSILEAAQSEGFDDSILFNRRNEVTETAVSNIAMFIDGQWWTPPLSSGILPGVTRAIAIEECEVKVRTIHISEIVDVEAAVLLASLRIVQPISHIGDMALDSAPGELHRKLHLLHQPSSVG